MLTAGPGDPLYQFGPFIADPVVGRLYHGDEVLPLTPKSFQVLMVLIHAQGQLVDKERLFQEVWPDTFVEPNNLARNISMIRKVLHERDPDREYIVTVSRRGYRFAAPVTQVSRAAFADHPHVPDQHADPEAADRHPELAVPVAAAHAVPDAAFTRRSSWPRRRELLSNGVLIVGLLGLAGTLALGAREGAGDRTPERRLWKLTTTGRVHAEPTWSPDGHSIAYSSDRGGEFNIWIQDLNGGSPRQLTTGPGRDRQPAWSPDGKRIAFRSERDGGGIFVVSTHGTPPRRVADLGFAPRWSPDGSRLVCRQGRDVYIVSPDGPPPRKLTWDGPQLSDPLYVAWHPDGERISVYGDNRRQGPGFWTVSVADGTAMRSRIAPSVARRLSEANLRLGAFVWSTGGDALFFEGRSERTQNLWRIKVNPRTLEWIGGPERLTTSAGLESGPALSPDGKRLAFGSRFEHTQVWSLPFDPAEGRITGEGQAVTPEGANARILDISPDGRQLVYRLIERNGDQLWIRSLDRQADRLRRVEVDATIVHPRWSRDGRQLAYLRRPMDPGEPPVLVLLAANDDLERHIIPSSPGPEMVYDWGHEPDTFLVRCKRKQHAICEFSAPAAGGVAPTMKVIAEDDARDLFAAQYSPDGRWISFIAAPDLGRSTVFVAPAKGGAWIPITSTDAHWFDDLPRWSPDGQTLYFLSNRSGFWNLWGRRFDKTAGAAIGDAFQVSHFDSSVRMVGPNVSGLQIAVTSDRLILPVTETTGSVWVLENVDQ